MIHFGAISVEEFLANYWQKKPLLIKQAIPDFISPITPEELAGLSLEDEFESRLITGSVANNEWTLSNGAFSEDTFDALPEKDWTLLVQGVDRFAPEIYDLIKHFDFIPRWRFDDVMISYATTGGSVGPHFDYYDVFLLQGSGKRRWHISSKHCELGNYLDDVSLRIMNQFEVEQIWDTEPGDVLYIPPKVAHHGISLDDQCTTLSFGYRSYTAKEMFDQHCPKGKESSYYQDPSWTNKDAPALIPQSAIHKANEMTPITDESFAQFVTKLDTLDQKNLQDFEFDNQDLVFNTNATYILHPICKIAYLQDDNHQQFFINGEKIIINKSDTEAMVNFCNHREINSKNHTNLSRQLFTLNLTYIKS